MASIAFGRAPGRCPLTEITFTVSIGILGGLVEIIDYLNGRCTTLDAN